MDFIQRLLKFPADERRKLLCDAICHKCKYPISSARLDYIVARLNLGRAYLIKTTSDPTKFLNIATSEHIETGERLLLSQVFPLYGQFTPGFFVKTNSDARFPITGELDKRFDAAAVKIAVSYFSRESISTTYTLVLYECGSKIV